MTVLTPIRILSFGYKYGDPPEGVFVVDCRELPNPFYQRDLKPLDGRDLRVQAFVKKDASRIRRLTSWAFKACDDGKTIAFGCVGGVHRSVAMAEIVAKALRDTGREVEITHTALL